MRRFCKVTISRYTAVFVKKLKTQTFLEFMSDCHDIEKYFTSQGLTHTFGVPTEVDKLIVYERRTER